MCDMMRYCWLVCIAGIVVRVDSVNEQRPARSLQDSHTLNTNSTQASLSSYAQYASIPGGGLGIGGDTSTAAIIKGSQGTRVLGLTDNLSDIPQSTERQLFTPDSHEHFLPQSNALDTWVIPLAAGIGALVLAAFLMSIVCAHKQRRQRQSANTQQTADQLNYLPSLPVPTDEYGRYSMHLAWPSNTRSQGSVVLSVSGPPDLSDNSYEKTNLSSRVSKGRFVSKSRFRHTAQRFRGRKRRHSGRYNKRFSRGGRR